MFFNRELFSAFGDDNHGFAENTVVNHIAGLKFGNDGSRRFFLVFDFLDDLVKIRVKFGIEKIHC